MSSDSGTTVQQGDKTGGGSTSGNAAQIISGGSSMFSFFTQLRAAKATANNLDSQAGELEQNARVEKVNADAAANFLRTQLNQTLANNAAAFSTANIDPTTGSARVIQQQSVSEANRGFFENDMNSRIRVATLKRQAAQAREDAHAVRKSGNQQFLIGGVSTIAKAVAMGA